MELKRVLFLLKSLTLQIHFYDTVVEWLFIMIQKVFRVMLP